VLLHRFVFSPKHLCHFKIPESEQEVRLVVQAVGHVITNENHKGKVFEVIYAGIFWTLWIEIRVIKAHVVLNIHNALDNCKEWTDEQQSRNSVDIVKFTVPVSIYKNS
jgi:hypothetical protein